MCVEKLGEEPLLKKSTCSATSRAWRHNMNQPHSPSPHKHCRPLLWCTAALHEVNNLIIRTDLEIWRSYSHCRLNSAYVKISAYLQSQFMAVRSLTLLGGSPRFRKAPCWWSREKGHLLAKRALFSTITRGAAALPAPPPPLGTALQLGTIGPCYIVCARGMQSLNYKVRHLLRF